MDKYKITGHLSAGAHGVVFKAVYRKPKSSKESDQTFAIKRMFIKNRQKMPMSVVREIKSLQLLAGHPFVVDLMDIFVLGSSVNLVFSLLPTNLTSLIYYYRMNSFHQKVYSYMICEGIRYMHQMDLIHRDLKPANLLIDWNGYLKICDFGQTRIMSQCMSHQVSTRWYRSPELLYGSETYDHGVDMWSLGCIIAEIYLQEPVFAADSDIAQLFMVISSLGPPPLDWAETLPDYNKISFTADDDELKDRHKQWKQALKEKITSETAFDLVIRLLRYLKRFDADEVVEHELFEEVRGEGKIQPDLLFKPMEVKHLVGPPRSTSVNGEPGDDGSSDCSDVLTSRPSTVTVYSKVQ